MRKILAFLVLSVFALASIAAFDINDSWTINGTIDQHPEILIGFIPTYGEVTAGYTGLQLMEGNRTEIQVTAGGGYIERRFWINPDTGKEDPTMNPLSFDVIQTTWSLRFNQGFLDSPYGDKDLITLSIGYEGRYEVARDSMASDSTKQAWGDEVGVETIDEFFTHYNSAGNDFPDRLYPDLRGNHQYLGTNLFFNFFLDAMEDTLSTNDGFTVEFNVDWSPYALNAALDGKADFYQFTLEGVGAKTLYQYKTEKMSWFSVVIADRLRLNWLSGNLVPTYVQKLGSLGRQVRGYSNYTYGMEFYVVNNFDIRLTGPDMGVDGLALRINLFFDMGYGCGNYFNTTNPGSQFLASTGAQFTISIFDIIDLGYQAAYLIGDGRNFAKGDTRYSGSFTFFLDF
ncbi:MAG: hypothetical protein IAA97_01135 [Spirochaetes bacterium]|uniref:Uncharacterized protein n=1 Tax=Candidatus Ornithospirochaeta stercoripullorum TaxID=2840899 RepID=A0A9D9DZV0_9SPIO|nr:hypothetical protein [Candidatus Ornithospirochaeta stercoripullorum]